MQLTRVQNNPTALNQQIRTKQYKQSTTTNLSMTAQANPLCGSEGVGFTDIPVCTAGIDTALDNVSSSAGPNPLQ